MNDAGKKEGIIVETLFLIVIVSLNMGTSFRLEVGGKHLNISYSEIFTIISLAIFVLKFKDQFKVPFGRYLFTKWLIIVWSIIVSFWASAIGQNLAVAMSFISGLLSFIFFYNVLSYNYNLFSKGLRIFGSILSILILVNVVKNIITGPSIDSYSFYTIKEFAKTPLGRSNYLSIYLEFLLLYEIVFRRKNWYKYSILYFIAIFATLSRMGIISLLGGLLLTFFLTSLYEKKKDKKNYYLGFVLLIPGLVKYIAKDVSQFTNFSSAGSRIEIWKQHLIVFKNSPVLGKGFQYTEIANAHNIILTILSSFGVVGFLLFGTLVLEIVNKMLNNIAYYRDIKWYEFSRLNAALLISFITIFFHSLFEPYFLGATSQIFTSAVIAAIYAEPSIRKAGFV